MLPFSQGKFGCGHHTPVEVVLFAVKLIWNTKLTFINRMIYLMSGKKRENFQYCVQIYWFLFRKSCFYVWFWKWCPIFLHFNFHVEQVTLKTSVLASVKFFFLNLNWFLCFRLRGAMVKLRDKFRHPECYTCTDCDVNLKQKGHFFVEDEIYCEKHARERVVPPEGYDVVTVFPK